MKKSSDYHSSNPKWKIGIPHCPWIATSGTENDWQANVEQPCHNVQSLEEMEGGRPNTWLVYLQPEPESLDGPEQQNEFWGNDLSQTGQSNQDRSRKSRSMQLDFHESGSIQLDLHECLFSCESPELSNWDKEWVFKLGSLFWLSYGPDVIFVSFVHNHLSLECKLCVTVISSFFKFYFINKQWCK